MKPILPLAIFTHFLSSQLICSSAFVARILLFGVHKRGIHCAQSFQQSEKRKHGGIVRKPLFFAEEDSDDNNRIQDETNSSEAQADEIKTTNSPSFTKDSTISLAQEKKMQNIDEDNQNYEYNIPKTGYSLADHLENKSPENRERFETILTPIFMYTPDNGGDVEIEYDQDGFPKTVNNVVDKGDQEEVGGISHQGVARIDTISTGNISEEPVRWLVSLGSAVGSNIESYALIDLPPYSDSLVNQIRAFMDPVRNDTIIADSEENKNSSKSKLSVILLTNQQCIHYDSSPAVYVTRKSDLKKWKSAFPKAQVVMYRLDIPRDCREEITQVLDGYGPWGWDENVDCFDSKGISVAEKGGKFVETGRPLKMEEWNEEIKLKIMNQGELPPDDQVDDTSALCSDSSGDDSSLYSTDAIRERESKYRLLAVYTPGHTFGSVTYIFPQRGICCSGYALPLECSDDIDSTQLRQGPRLDYQGYLATSVSRPRQMSSALSLINDYIDRFTVVLPARGEAVILDSDLKIRKRELMESVGLYQKISDIYSRLGIVE